MCWVYIMKTTSQVFDKFLEWITLMENLHRYKIKTLHTNKRGEYTSNKFTGCLKMKQEGMFHELIMPKTPQQNGSRKDEQNTG